MTNILSIDWDYFIDVDSKIRALNFPDGGTEYVNHLMNTIWATHYQNGENKDLLDVDVDKDKLDELKSTLKANGLDGATVALAESHMSIVKLIWEFEDDMDEGLNIINIDFHHDSYNYNDNINCGNWVNYLMDNKQVNSFKWIKKTDSDVDGVNESIEISEQLKIDFEDIDYLFLCKSGAWSPPHLDDEFFNLVYFLRYNGGIDNLITYHEDILKSRYAEVKNIKIPSPKQLGWKDDNNANDRE